ncbi:hypothetical protein [Pseudoduganella sp. UC29_71]|uniref:hypothetical protein n=1 Tax=Pseudoduganella sp. UC29_71 TaxID=3350174 RepID=UPI00366AF186
MISPVEISASEQDRPFWLSQGLASKNADEVAAADILIVPLKDFREGIPFAFHQDTIAVARFLGKALSGKASLEVLADDDEFVELMLHSAEFRFSTIIVSYLIAPLVVGLLTNYLYDVLKAKPGDSVEMNLIVEDQQCRSMKVNFKGDAKDFNQMADKVGQLSRECAALGPATKANSTPRIPASSKASANGQVPSNDRKKQ